MDLFCLNTENDVVSGYDISLHHVHFANPKPEILYQNSGFLLEIIYKTLAAKTKWDTEVLIAQIHHIFQAQLLRLA